MAREIADEIEVRREAGVAQHAPGVAADREDPAGFDAVVCVEHEGVRLFGDAAAIDDGLAVVLAGRLQIVDAEQLGGTVLEQLASLFDEDSRRRKSGGFAA